MELKKKNWQDVTITDYKKITEISNRELDSDLEKGIAILSVLCEVNEEDIYDMPINEIKGLLDGIKWINNYEFNKNWNLKHLVINGEKYDIDVDINHFTVAQYADFQIYWDHRDDPEYMGKILTIFIRPHKKKYNDGYDVLELAQVLEDNISINDWNGVCFFFLKDGLISLKASLLYSNWIMTKMIWKEKDKEKKKLLKEKRKELLMQINSIKF